MATELFNYFEGDWSFTREIKTDGDKLFGLAKGKASFTKDTNESLYYSEDGELDLQQSKTKNDFYKSYFFSFYKDHIKVYFSGGANSEQFLRHAASLAAQVRPTMFPPVRGTREMVGAARQVQHELVTEQRDGGVAELEKAIPFENAGPPERHRQRHAHDQLNHGR